MNFVFTHWKRITIQPHEDYNLHMYIMNKKVALFTNARDEKHIKEWAAHHLLIGFEYIFIFDHKSTQKENL